MKTQKQIWKDINEPKTETLIIEWDKDENNWSIMEILDRIPTFLKERRKPQ